MDNPPQGPEWTPASVLTLIAHLVRRPARTDRRLPLIWLSGRQGGSQVLSMLLAWLQRPSRYGVPYARVTASPEQSHGDLRPLLHSLCVKLAAPRFGGERLWFRHYELIEWVMGQDLSEVATSDRATVITRLLRSRHRPLRVASDEPEGNTLDLGPHYRLLIWLLRRVAPDALFRAAVSGNIPGFGSRYRWFMRQQYLAPMQSMNFLGFAERLTEGARQSEDTDQLNKLLVHAFLQDLRRAYARRPWRIEGWRRTAYPVVLIEDAADGFDGYHLLQLINDVRNETGRSDPLLAVCTSDQVPHGSAKFTGHRLVEPENLKLQRSDPVYGYGIYRNWVGALPGSRRARVDTAWYLPVPVTEPDEPEPALGGPPLDLRGPPWFARRSVVACVVLVFFLSVTGFVGWQYGGGLACPHLPFAGHVKVQEIDGECIGYSDSGRFRFNSQGGQEKLRNVQNTIFEQNRKVRAIWEDSNRTRPYVTIVYLGSLTGRETTRDEEAYSAEREELEGLAVAQYDGMQEPATSYVSPLLNIVIANGGPQMKHAGKAVDMIADLAEEDPTVVAVVGMVESRRNTARAIKQLHKVGLPVIAPTLSADHFDTNSRLYLQLSAPNRDQAAMIGEYADQVLKVSEARIYWTVGNQSSYEEDLYVKTLVDDLKRILPEDFEIDVQDRGKFDGSLGLNECGYKGMLIFAGRWTEFHRFLKELEKCGENKPSHLVGDDSVNRYMANPTLRRSAPVAMEVTYVSKSTLGTCKHLKAAQARGDSVRDNFLRWIQAPELLDPPRCAAGNEPVGERVPLAYDSAMMILEAVEGLAAKRPNDPPQVWDPYSMTPIAVHTEVLRLTRISPFDGVSGSTAFRVDKGEPVEKRISLLKVDSIRDLDVPPVEVFHCGHAQPNDDASCRR